MRSTPESGPRANGAKRERGSKLHMTVDTSGHLPALHVTPANVDDRAEVGKLAEAVRQATGESVELIYVDQGYTEDEAVEKGFVLLPERWEIERSFAAPQTA